MAVVSLKTRSPDFGVVELSGSARERGYKYGEKFSSNIEEVLNMSYTLYSAANISKGSILGTAGKFFAPIENYSPEIAEELRGMAEGSGRELAEVVLLTSFNELVFPLVFGSPMPRCTSFCATGQATCDGETFVGQNNDGTFAPDGSFGLDEYDFMMRSTTDSGVQFLTLNIMGCPAYIGMNSKGVGLCINALSDGSYRVGVPFTVITREVLGSKSAAEAVDAVTKAERGAGANYVVADENGECWDIETTAHSFNKIRVEACQGHANNYLVLDNIKQDMGCRSIPSTVTRSDRMNALLKQHYGKIDIESCFRFLGDHGTSPYTICTHPDETVPIEMRWKSMDSVVSVPAKREMWVTRDNPCKGGFKKYVL